MARKLKKSSAQILSLLFHLVVLCGMVMLYDAGKALAVKLGYIEGVEGAADKFAEASIIDFSEEEEKLSTEIDSGLKKYIDKNEEGYRLRTDGPFPSRLKVVVTDIARFDDLLMAERVGDESVSKKLTTMDEEVMEYEIAGNAVRFIKQKEVSQRKRTPAERVERLKVLAEAKEKGIKAPPDPDRIEGDLVGKAVQFNYKDGKWKAKSTGEFKTMAWGRGLEDEVDDILVDNGLRPKSRWFGKSRIPIGHKLKLTGSNLDIVADDVAKGYLDMEFTAVEGVHGHPCAVFDVAGSFELEDTTDALGRSKTGEETVEGGRIWVSLLYPVVLRMELDLIVSYEIREKGKLVQQLQGRASRHMHADWKPVTVKPKKKASPEGESVKN